MFKKPIKDQPCQPVVQVAVEKELATVAAGLAKTQLYKIANGTNWQFSDKEGVDNYTSIIVKFNEDFSTFYGSPRVILGDSYRADIGSGADIVITDPSTAIVFSNGDTLDAETGIYTFAAGVPNYFDTPDLDPSDNNLAISEEILVALDTNGLKHKISKALNFVGDENQISIATQVDGTVTITLSEDLVLNTIEAQSADFHGDVTIDQGGSLDVDSTVKTQALILKSYTQAQVDAGEAPTDSLIRIVG